MRDEIGKEATYKSFPPSCWKQTIKDPGNYPEIPYNPQAYHWSYVLLPHVEQTNLQSSIPPVLNPNWTTDPYRAALQLHTKLFRCPSTSDQLTYEDNSRGMATPGRVAASYGVVISGSIGNPATSRSGEQSSHMDDGSPGPANGPFGFRLLMHSRFDGPFNQNSAYRFSDISDGASNTAAIGERYRIEQSNGNADAGWGYWAIGSPTAQDQHAQFSGTTGMPFNIFFVVTSNTQRKQNYCGFRSRHSGGVNFVFLDGSVRFLTDRTSDEARLAIGTRAGGESINWND